jgi:hypothetical protein
MITEKDCIGTDRDGDRVYLTPDGGWIGCKDATDANTAMAVRKWRSFSPSDYEANFGPVTRS